MIAIIAILAAILFPVFARVRENARRASCSSNLKQIGLGLLQYTQDYDELLAMAYFGPSDGPSDNANRYKWMDAIQPYVKSTQLFTCPSDTDVTSGARTNYTKYIPNTELGKNGLPALTQEYFGSYGVNNCYKGTPHEKLFWRHFNGSWAIREGDWKMVQEAKGEPACSTSPKTSARKMMSPKPTPKSSPACCKAGASGTPTTRPSFPGGAVKAWSLRLLMMIEIWTYKTPPASTCRGRFALRVISTRFSVAR